MAAAGTKQGVKTILGLHSNDPGQFKDLMAQWLSCGVDGSARTPGGNQDGIHLLGRQQVPLLAFMPRLTALFAFSGLFPGYSSSTATKDEDLDLLYN